MCSQKQRYRGAANKGYESGPFYGRYGSAGFPLQPAGWPPSSIPVERSLCTLIGSYLTPKRRLDRAMYPSSTSRADARQFSAFFSWHLIDPATFAESPSGSEVSGVLTGEYRESDALDASA